MAKRGPGEGCGPPYKVGWFVVHIRIRGFHLRDLPSLALDVHTLLLALHFLFAARGGYAWAGCTLATPRRFTYFCPVTMC